MKNSTKKSLKLELSKMRAESDKAINNTRNEAKTFWVGFNQAVQNLQQRFNLDNQ